MASQSARVLSKLSQVNLGQHKLLIQNGLLGYSRCMSTFGSKSSRNPHAVNQLHPSSVSRRAVTTSSTLQSIVNCPYPDVSIPDDIHLVQYLFDDLGRYGENIAYVNGDTGKPTTFGELQSQIVKVASALVKLGYKKGDVVTLFSPNCPEYAALFLGVAAMGGITSCLNPVYTVAELEHALCHADSKLLVTSQDLIAVSKEAVKKCPTVKEIIVFGEAEGIRPFSNLLSDNGQHFPDNLDFDVKEDLVSLPYSSGTTGLPKGVMLTHYNIVANMAQALTEEIMGYNRDDCFVGVLPFFHIYGQVLILLEGLKQGIKTVTVPKFDPQQYLRVVKENNASFLHVVPPIMLFLAKHPLVNAKDFQSVHTLITAAAPVGKEVVAEAVDRLGIPRVRQGYGLTEASPLTHANPVEGYKYHTVGPAIHNTQCKIICTETGDILPPGKDGEVLIKGPQIMKGYYNNPEATAKTVKDGWLYTGDIGHHDEDEHLVISDRLKELIKVKGFQVAPAELEALLVTHPAIQDAAVIGIPDDRAGELPRAYVVTKPNMEISEEEVKKFVEGKVAPFKKLEGGVEFRGEIPKSASGKILRRFLKPKGSQS